MKKYSIGQILRFLEQVKVGRLNISDACRDHQITRVTYYRWLKQYGGMRMSKVQKVKALEEERVRLNGLEKENARLKRLVADQALDIHVLKQNGSLAAAENRGVKSDKVKALPAGAFKKKTEPAAWEHRSQKR